MTETVRCSVTHVTAAGGENLSGITIEDNQDEDCFSIRSDNHDGSEDLIHFCDWPALKAAIDQHQAERGGKTGDSTNDRELLGRIVRETWVAWALEQPDVAEHPSWTAGWDELPGRDREVDMRIGAAVAAVVRGRLTL